MVACGAKAKTSSVSPRKTRHAGSCAAAAIDDAASAGALRAREMARFYRFIDARMPDLMREWEELRER